MAQRRGVVIKPEGQGLRCLLRATTEYYIETLIVYVKRPPLRALRKPFRALDYADFEQRLQRFLFIFQYISNLCNRP